MTYYIFGDSYGDPGGNVDPSKKTWAWHKRLQKHDRVKNFCKGVKIAILHHYTNIII